MKSCPIKNKFCFISVLLVVLSLKFFVIFPTPCQAIAPPGIKPIPNIPFVTDSENLDWSQIKPEWGPVGSWCDFGVDLHCGSGNPIDYIKRAQNQTVTLDNGQVIPKPVGVGIRFSRSSISNWVTRIAQDSVVMEHLAFLVYVSSSKFGEVHGPYSDRNGDFPDTVGEAKAIMGELSQAFPTIPIIFQSCGPAGDLLNQAVTNGYKNVGVKCNGWDVDHNEAMMYKGSELIGGRYGFASKYYQERVVGFEPQHGFSIEDTYWAITQALSHHPDLFDIDDPDLDQIARFKNLYGLDLFRFLRDHTGKTLANSPDVWIVFRETKRSDGTCWRDTNSGLMMCPGPQKGNFSYWLYQNDNLTAGRTKLIGVEGNPLPSSLTNHAYGKFPARQTDQPSGNRYLYFDINDGYQALTSNQSWTVKVVLANQGNDSLSIEYLSKSGQTIRKSINKGADLGPINNWVEYQWDLNDADFSSNKIEGAADFRIDSENDGPDEIIHRIIVSPGTAPDGNSPEPAPDGNPTPPNQPPFWMKLKLGRMFTEGQFMVK